MVKKMYKHYFYTNGLIIPATPDDVATPILFNKSIVVHKVPQDWLQNTIVDPAEISEAIKEAPAEIYRRDDGFRFYTKSKTQNCHIMYGKEVKPEDVDEYLSFPGLKCMKAFNPNDYSSEYLVDTKIISELKENTHSITIEIDPKINLKMLITKQLFPGLLRAQEIKILAKESNSEYNNNIFDVAIVTICPEWDVYSFHKIIVI
jgi:hypothetical protein